MKSKKVGIYRSAKYNDISKYNPPEDATTKVKNSLKCMKVQVELM